MPSPYLDGLFNELIKDNPNNLDFICTVETVRGCPYRCTFCEIGHLNWQKILVDGWHDVYDEKTLWKNFLHLGNQTLVRDLISAIEESREPLSSIQSVCYVNEIVQGVYLSHLSNGCRMDIPLQDRTHPLPELPN